MTSSLVFMTSALSSLTSSLSSRTSVSTVPTSSTRSPLFSTDVPTTTTFSGTTYGPTTTITAVLGLSSGYAGSIIAADACDTTFALVCTDLSNDICAAASGATITVTHHPTAWEYHYGTSTLGGRATISQSCVFSGPSTAISSAVCDISLDVSALGTATASATRVTETDPAAFTYAAVPVTAGASKLPAAGAVCTPTGTSDSGGAPTGLARVYKVLIPVGVAVVAGAGVVV